MEVVLAFLLLLVLRLELRESNMAIYTKWTRFGRVYRSTICKDDWTNIVEKDREGYKLKLQSPAMRSFRSAERRLGREIKLTGTWRSCAFQAQLYQSDTSRFAHPNSTLHTQGLAIDVSTAQGDQERIRTLLKRRGWTQSRPVDEPWHYSYGWTA